MSCANCRCLTQCCCVMVLLQDAKCTIFLTADLNPVMLEGFQWLSEHSGQRLARGAHSGGGHVLSQTGVCKSHRLLITCAGVMPQARR